MNTLRALLDQERKAKTVPSIGLAERTAHPRQSVDRAPKVDRRPLLEAAGCVKGTLGPESGDACPPLLGIEVGATTM